MTLDAIMRDIEAMREDLIMFERKYCVPTEVFYQAYQQGIEPAEQSWVMDWSEWAGTYQILVDRLQRYDQAVRQLVEDAAVADVSELIAMTSRHEPIAVPG
ncbi:MAG: hypothetical protein U0641_02470 [Anaerolineae bacterium]